MILNNVKVKKSKKETTVKNLDDIMKKFNLFVFKISKNLKEMNKQWLV